MKQLLSLTLLLFLGVAFTFAQDEEYTRKTWDFTKGLSDETRADLDADKTNWTIDATDADGNSTRWKDAKKLTGILTANGNVIKELDGISWGSAGLSSSNNILIFLDHIRVTRKNMEFTLKTKVKGGQVIRMIYKSANATATNRGIHCKTSGVTLTQGEEIAKGPQAEGGQQGWGDERIWTVNESVTEPMEVTFQMAPDGGVEIGYIIIDNGDAPEVKDPAKVAFVYDSSVEGYDLDSDYLYVAAAGGDAQVTPIDVKDASYDSLLEYEVVVVSNAINPENASVIKTAIAFVPMLVNGTALYPVWGLGTPTVAEGEALTIKNEDHGLFANLDTEEPLNMAAVISTVELGEYFANDDVLATVGDAVAIHQHNAKRNSYIMLPYDQASMEGANVDNMMVLVANAIDVLRDTKKDVVATATPTISQDLQDGSTVVTIKGSGTVYYTLDGTDPTVESAVYAEPLTFTEAATVKAIAVADGYLASQVATADVQIFTMAAAPSIAVQQVDGKAVVTFTAEEGATVYYNYSGSEDVASSAAYAEPISVERTAAITAFAVADGKLNSPAVTENIVVDGYKFYTELSHFDASSAQTGTSSNGFYFYTWGKNGQSYWSDEVESETHVTGSEGQDSIIYTYKPANILETVYVEGCDWRMASEGQVMVWQNTGPTNNVGNEGGYNPETVEDWGASKFDVQFAKVPTGSPNTANIMSVKKFQAPFEVVLYMGNASGGSPCQADILVATDTLGTWTNIATIDGSATKRLLKKGVAVYNGTDEVYVKVASAQGSSKVAMIFDIIVNGVGEYNAIESVNNDAAPARKSNAIFNLAGQKVSADYRGIVIMNGKKVMVK